MSETLKNAWARPWTDVLTELGVAEKEGLHPDEVRKRSQQYGPNELRQAKKKSAWVILANQFRSMMVLLLTLACGLSFAFGDWVEGTAIAAVILINAAIGFFTEIGAIRSMEALRKLSSVTAKVRREGDVREIPAREIVPGDIVVLEGGDIITADLRLIEASKLQADESALTGESMPVSKKTEELDESAPLAERKNMLYKGTAVTRGSGSGVAVATGMKTELGQISSLVEEAEEERTPLEKRLDQLGGKLIWAVLVIAVFVAVSGIIGGKEMFLMIETAIALAVAAVPEGLPVVATIALARGMLRMARRNALINRLSAVESLGATNVIFTDKTGTLTENRMTVTEIFTTAGKSIVGKDDFSRDGETVDPTHDSLLRETLEIGAFCNNASLREREENGENKSVGDPMEIALLAAAAKAGMRRRDLVDRSPEVREEAFDPDTKMMATYHRQNSRIRVAVKGAPEAVLGACSSVRTPEGDNQISDEDRAEWQKRNQQMAEEGLRILAAATKEVESENAHPYDNLVFLGLFGLEDPPRADVQPAIKSCKTAGIRVLMVTGDQPVTARNIALAVGLTEDGETEVIEGKNLRNPDELSEEDRRHLLKTQIFARVSPKQKLDLIALHQKNNSVVAMTGDGVNDAPALKKADIGVAMGLRGTQVAQEAADMILKDDAFSTIVAAVEQGRAIFTNIRKFVVYLLSCNVSEIMVVGLASVVNAPLPILPLQILFLNLVTDVFPALALGLGEADPGVMRQPPRDPKEPFLGRPQWFAVTGYGLTITVSVLGAFALAFQWMGRGPNGAVTISFLTLAFAQLWHVFNMRNRGSRLLQNEVTRNPFVWGALALCVGILLAATYIPIFSRVLKVQPPGAEGWILILAASFVPLLLGQIWNSVRSGLSSKA